MSARATAWAFARRGLDPGAHLLLLWLADQACDEGVVGLFKAVSRRTMADVFGCSMDTVDRRVKALVAAGLMAVERRRAEDPEGAVTQLPSVYRLALEPHATPQSTSQLHPSRTDAATPPPSGETPEDPSRSDAPSRMDAATPGRAGAATLAASVRPPPPQGCGYPSRSGAALAREVISREYSEPSEPGRISSSSAVAVAGAAALRGPAASVVAAVASPWLDPAKSLGLVTTAGEVARWIAAGADLEGVIIPVVAHAMARPRDQAVTSWKYFERAIQRALREAKAAAEPLAVPVIDGAPHDPTDPADGRQSRNGHGLADPRSSAGRGAPPRSDPPPRNDPGAQRAARQRGLLAALSELRPGPDPAGEPDLRDPGVVALPLRPSP